MDHNQKGKAFTRSPPPHTHRCTYSHTISSIHLSPHASSTQHTILSICTRHLGDLQWIKRTAHTVIMHTKQYLQPAYKHSKITVRQAVNCRKDVFVVLKYQWSQTLIQDQSKVLLQYQNTKWYKYIYLTVETHGCEKKSNRSCNLQNPCSLSNVTVMNPGC